MHTNNFGVEDFEAFAYLDYHNPATAWNIARGWFCSPSELPENGFNENFLSIALAGMLSNSTPERLTSEIAIDSIRKLFFPKCVSRLKGFFVFDEIDSIARFWENNNWGGHFSDKYLSDVGVAATKSTRTDSNWITEIVDINGKLKENWEENSKRYWSGERFPQSEPVWERITEGFLTIWSNSIREEAIREIEYYSPESLKLLVYSCYCAAYQSFDGLLFPFIEKDQSGSQRLVYLMNMRHADDDDFIKRVIENDKKIPHFKAQLRNVVTNTTDIVLPNFGSLTTELNDECQSILSKINK